MARNLFHTGYAHRIIPSAAGPRTVYASDTGDQCILERHVDHLTWTWLDCVVRVDVSLGESGQRTWMRDEVSAMGVL